MDLSIGVRIKERRKALKITGAQIKEKTGISTGNLSDIENGKCLPSAIALIQLSKILNCSTDYILLGDGALQKEPCENSDIRASEAQLLEQFRVLTEEDKEEIQIMIQLKYNRRVKAKNVGYL